MRLGSIVDERAKFRGRAFAVAAVMFAVAGVGLIGLVVAAAPGGSAVSPGGPEASAGRPEPRLRASWTWTGGGADDEWSTVQNWSGAGGACPFPCSTADDVSVSLCAFNIEPESNRTIDDLSLSVNQGGCGGTFDGLGNEVTVTCDTVTITGNNGGGDTPLGIKVINGAAIETD